MQAITLVTCGRAKWPVMIGLIRDPGGCESESIGEEKWAPN